MNNFFLLQSSTGFIAGSVADYASLPTPPSSYANQLWYVLNGSGGLFSLLGAYKYPKGLYAPNALGTAWEQAPINVKVAEDSTTLVNITNWAEFTAYSFDVSIGDRVIYNDIEYRNLTANVGSPPDVDTVNWKQVNHSIENTITVAKSGGDFTSIKDALASVLYASATKQYTIIVYPGVYIEDNPIQLKSYVTLVGSAKYTTQIEPITPSVALFIGADSTTIDQFTLAGVTGSGNYALTMGTSGEMFIQNIILNNCSNGFFIDNTNAVVNITDVFIINDTVSATNGIRISSGRADIKNIKCIGEADVTNIVSTVGGNSTALIESITSNSLNVNRICFVNRGNLSGSGIYAQNPLNGIVVQGNNVRVRLNNIQISNAQTDGIRVNDTGNNIHLALYSSIISDSGNLNLNILNPDSTVILSGFTEFNKIFANHNARCYTSLLDDVEDDAGLNILGELHVGSPERNAEAVIGGGDSYTRGMLVYTETPGNVFADVSDSAKSASGSTFTFTGTALNNSIYIASSLTDGVDFLKHLGIKTKVDTAAIKGADDIIIEYWNGSTWTSVNGMEVLANDNYIPYGNDYFSNGGSYQIRYDVLLNNGNWVKNDPMSLGTNYYWVRFRIINNITTAPIFQQFKLHTDRFEVNADGFIEYFGAGRPQGTIPWTWGIFGGFFGGEMGNQPIFISDNIYTQFSDNEWNTNNDKTGFVSALPLDMDTSSGLIVKWSCRPDFTGNVTWSVRWGYTTDGDTIYTSAATAPTTHPTEQSIVLTNEPVVVGIQKTFIVNIDVSKMVSRRNTGEGDTLFVSIEMTTSGGDIAGFVLNPTYYKWAAGGHVG